MIPFKRSERGGMLMKSTFLVSRDLRLRTPRFFGDDLAVGIQWPLNSLLNFAGKTKTALPPTKAEEYS